MEQTEKFSKRAADLAKAHGVTASTISNWTKGGAFKHAMRGVIPLYHEECMTYTLGTIKQNISMGKYKNPEKRIPVPIRDKPIKISEAAVVMGKLNAIIAQLEDVSRRLVRIETKIHNFDGTNTTKHTSTIGEMVKKSLK